MDSQKGLQRVIAQAVHAANEYSKAKPQTFAFAARSPTRKTFRLLLLVFFIGYFAYGND